VSDEIINEMAKAMWRSTFDDTDFTEEDMIIISGDDWHQFIDYAKSAYSVVADRLEAPIARISVLEDLTRELSRECNAEYVRTIELEAENKTLRDLLELCADELEACIDYDYKKSDGSIIPEHKSKYERDMAPVVAARVALKVER
jgi:hypothetical protein